MIGFVIRPLTGQIALTHWKLLRRVSLPTHDHTMSLGPHTHSGPCQWMLWPGARAGRGGQMGRLSYHLRGAARGGRGTHNKVICPSLALEPPLDAGQPHPLSSSSDCHASAASPRRPGRADCWGGGMGWKRGAMGRRDDPRERKPFVQEKMSRLAFRLRGEIEIAL